MLVAGTNFAPFYLLVQDEYGEFLRDREFQAYVGANAGLMVVLSGFLFTGSAPALELGGVTRGVATVLVLLDAGRVGPDVTVPEAASASLATIGNIGPGFGFLGPFGSYLSVPWTSKLLMIFLMWIDRLEIIPVFVVFTGAFWTE